MSLVIFDLDNTLIGGDSDYLWGRFLVERGIVDENEYEKKNASFYDDYLQGTLDITAFLQFALQPLAANDIETLFRLREQFIEEKIKPILLPSAGVLIDQHRKTASALLVITATNHFVTEPIVELLGIEHLLATMPQRVNGRFTGKYEGVPCFREGKVTRLQHWLSKNQRGLEGSWFYSDSHNDIPLLSLVDNPVAVDPDEKLEGHAKQLRWPIISLR